MKRLTPSARVPERRLAPVENRTPHALRAAELVVNGLARYTRPAGDRSQGGPCAARNIDRRLKNDVVLVPVDRSALSTQGGASADQLAARGPGRSARRGSRATAELKIPGSHPTPSAKSVGHHQAGGIDPLVASISQDLSMRQMHPLHTDADVP